MTRRTSRYTGTLVVLSPHPPRFTCSNGPGSDTTLRVYSGATWSLLYSYTGTGFVDWYSGGAPAGDCDGFDDFAIVSSSYYGGSAVRDEIRVFSGASGAILHVLHTTAPGERVWEVVNVGDADGDGQEDLAVSVGSYLSPLVTWHTRVFAGGSGVTMTDGAGELLFPYSTDWVYGFGNIFQCWYRDSTTGPCGSGNNYSNVVEVPIY